jgi:SOS-response transcriptional repressor LexA
MRHQTTIEVYQFLKNYFQEHGFAPTHQEIADALYVARSGVSRHLDKLTIWGWISREDGKARTIRLLEPSEDRNYLSDHSKM